MTDKDKLQEAFLAGYELARNSGFTSNKLSKASRRAALTNFDRWRKIEKEK
jgi:hypothetical protein